MSASVVRSDLVARLGTMATVLVVAATTSVTTVTLQHAMFDATPSYATSVTAIAPQYAMAQDTGSSIDRTRQGVQAPAPTIKTIQLAIDEVRRARAILKTSELAEDAAFLDYLSAVDEVLDAYEAEGEHESSMRGLIARFAFARARLEGSVTRLTTWLALSAVTRPDERYPAVPARFASKEASALDQTQSPSAEDIDAWYLASLV